MYLFRIEMTRNEFMLRKLHFQPRIEKKKHMLYNPSPSYYRFVDITKLAANGLKLNYALFWHRV